MPSLLFFTPVHNHKMTPFSPIYALSVPILFSLTLPLAFFGTLTTIFACSILLIRLLVTYTEIALELIPHYLFRKLRPPPFVPTPSYNGAEIPTSSGAARNISSNSKRFRSQSYSSSKLSSALTLCSQQQYLPNISNSTSSITVRGYNSRRTDNLSSKRKASLPFIKLSPVNLTPGHSLSPSSAPKPARNNTPQNTPTTPLFSLPIYTSSISNQPRDFEGLGGWRFDCAPEETLAFTNINSRLELPGIAEYGSPLSSPLHHRCSLAGGSVSQSLHSDFPLPSNHSYRPPIERCFETQPKTSCAGSRAGSFAGSATYNDLKNDESSSRRNNSATVALNQRHKSLSQSNLERRKIERKDMVLPLMSPQFTHRSLPTPLSAPAVVEVPSLNARGRRPSTPDKEMETTYFPPQSAGAGQEGYSKTDDSRKTESSRRTRGDSGAGMKLRLNEVDCLGSKGGEQKEEKKEKGMREGRANEREREKEKEDERASVSSSSSLTSDDGVVLSLKMRSI